MLVHIFDEICTRIDRERGGRPASRLRTVTFDYVVHADEYELSFTLENGIDWHLRLSNQLLWQQLGRQQAGWSARITALFRTYYDGYFGRQQAGWSARITALFRTYYDGYFGRYYPVDPVMSHAFGLNPGQRRVPQQNYDLAYQQQAALERLGAPDVRAQYHQQMMAARMQAAAMAMAMPQAMLPHIPPPNYADENLPFSEIERFELSTPKPNGKGWTLLMDNLTEEQRQDFRTKRYFQIAGQSGNLYRIKYGGSHNIRVFEPDSWKIYTICFLTADGLCRGDKLLAQKLAIETREQDVLKVANR